VIEASAPANLDQIRRAVEVAQKAFDQLTAEAEATHRELVVAQHRTGFCVRDVVRAELLRMAREVEEHDRAAEALRANLQQAGYVTANLQRRRNWHGRIFTESMTAALHYRASDRPPAASVDWEDFINRLYDDPDAALRAAG